MSSNFSITTMLAAIRIAILGATSAGTAHGADLAVTRAPAEKEQELQEIIVTGTSIRGVNAVGSDTTIIDRAAIEQSGYNNPVELLRTLPQVQGLGYDDTPHVAQNGQANVQRGTSISLRGLSANATLVLVDGRRIAQTGNVTSFTEANQLPLSFIERVDIVADGASAVYGSDAVAGVVNYITRKNFTGVEPTLRYGSGHGWDEHGASLLAGTQFDDGGFLGRVNGVIAFDYDDRSAMLQAARPFLRQDLRPYGGPDTRIRTNLATSAGTGNIIVPRTGLNPTLITAGTFDYYGLPADYSGTGGTGAILRFNDPNLLDEADYRDYIPHTIRKQASINLSADMPSGWYVYFQAYYNGRESTTKSLVTQLGSSAFTLPSTSPYYISGVPGVAARAPITISTTLLDDVGRVPLGLGGHVIANSKAQTAGVRHALFADWQGEATFTRSVSDTCANCIGELMGNFDSAAFQRALNNGTYNPFSTTPASADVLRTFLPAGYDQNSSILNQASLRFDGSLFSLPTGKVRSAVGYEYVHTKQTRDSINIKFTSDTRGALGKRNIKSIYGELFVPVVPADTIPLVRSLDLDVAVRSEDYSDLGRTTNPKFGVVWTLNHSLKLRGSWGRSFRAPNITEANTTFFSSTGISLVANGASDPTLPLSNAATGQSYALTNSGSNPQLKPEQAKNLTVGFDFAPESISGLKISGTYYHVEYENQIIGLQTYLTSFIANPANRALYAPYITPVTQPTTCVGGNRSTYAPAAQAIFALPSLAVPDETNACRIVAIFNGRNTNAASTRQNGFDLQGSYVFDTSIGQFLTSLSGTKILNNKIRTTHNAAEFDGIDRMNYPVSLRGRAAIGWSRGPLTANLAMNYIGSYVNDLPLTIARERQPVKDVPSWQTLDLALAYAIGDYLPALSKTRLSLNLQNALDRDPPTVLSTNGYAVDIQTHNVMGRMFAVQLSKAF